MTLTYSYFLQNLYSLRWKKSIIKENFLKELQAAATNQSPWWLSIEINHFYKSKEIYRKSMYFISYNLYEKSIVSR